jgi:hypothetical protein
MSVVKPGDLVAIQFTTINPSTGAATDADSAPTGTLIRNGANTAEAVTIANITTGVYSATVTVPSGYVAGDEIQIRVAATVNSVAGQGVVWQTTLDTTRVSEVAGAVGSGAVSTTIEILDSSNNPIDGVEVWITTDSAGSNVVAGTLVTDAFGYATFMLDVGAYYRWAQKAGYNFTNPAAFSVS